MHLSQYPGTSTVIIGYSLEDIKPPPVRSDAGLWTELMEQYPQPVGKASCRAAGLWRPRGGVGWGCGMKGVSYSRAGWPRRQWGVKVARERMLWLLRVHVVARRRGRRETGVGVGGIFVESESDASATQCPRHPSRLLSLAILPATSCRYVSGVCRLTENLPYSHHHRNALSIAYWCFLNQTMANSEHFSFLVPLFLY